MFRQQSVKTYATMPTGIMGSISLACVARLRLTATVFQQDGRRKHEYIENTREYVLLPFITLKHLELQSSN